MLKLNSLRKKFILLIIVILVVVFSVSGLVLSLSNISKTKKQLSDQSTAFATLSTKPLAEAKDLYFNSGYFKFVEVFSGIKNLDPNITKIQFIDVNGNIILDSDKIGNSSYESGNNETVNKETLTKVLSDKPVYVNTGTSSNEITEIYYPYFSDWGSHPYTIRYFVSYDEVRSNIITIIEQTIILMLISFVLITLVIERMVNRLILAPITQVSKLTQRISAGKYGERIKIRTHDEIEDMANSTNRMARKLEQDIIDLKELDKLKDEFIDIAAHNFKAPLNHLKYDIAYLLKTVIKKVSEKEFALMEDINISGKKLQLLSEDLIGIQALKNNSETGNVFVPVDLKKLIGDVLNESKQSAESKNIKLKTELPQSATVLGDYMKLKQMLLNVVDNAIEYTDKKEGIVTISIQEKGNSYIVEVADDGVGMTDEEVKKIFQKFYRAPSSSVYNKEGAGLGLYLAKLIIGVHHGNIWVESTKDKGSKFYISLLKKETI